MKIKATSCNVEDDGLFLSPANFELKVLTEQIEIYHYKSLLGIHLVSVSKWEFEIFPDIFRVYDEKSEEIKQSELKGMYK